MQLDLVPDLPANAAAVDSRSTVAVPRIFGIVNRDRAWVRVAVIVWAAILIAVCMRAILKPHSNSVYPIFAGAGRDWLAGLDLYHPTGDPFRYSPLVAVFLVPFSYLSDEAGGVLWRLLNAAIYLGALAWWARAVLPRALSLTQTAALFLLVVPLSIGSLNNGQSNALVIGLLLAAVAGVTRGGWNMAAACLALACLFKVYPIAIGLLLAAVYPRRFGWRLAIALAIGLTLPYLFQHWDYVTAQYGAWLHHLRSDDRQLVPELAYRDFRLLCSACRMPIGSTTYIAIQILVAGSFAVCCLAARRAAWEPRRLLTFLLALGCSWMTVFGSAAESCTYILLAPSLAWAVLDSWSNRRSWLLTYLVLASYSLFTITQMAVWFPSGRAVHNVGFHPLAGLVLLLCVLLGALRGEAERRISWKRKCGTDLETP